MLYDIPTLGGNYCFPLRRNPCNSAPALLVRNAGAAGHPVYICFPNHRDDDAQQSWITNQPLTSLPEKRTQHQDKPLVKESYIKRTIRNIHASTCHLYQRSENEDEAIAAEIQEELAFNHGGVDARRRLKNGEVHHTRRRCCFPSRILRLCKCSGASPDESSSLPRGLDYLEVLRRDSRVCVSYGDQRSLDTRNYTCAVRDIIRQPKTILRDSRGVVIFMQSAKRARNTPFAFPCMWSF